MMRVALQGGSAAHAHPDLPLKGTMEKLFIDFEL